MAAIPLAVSLRAGLNTWTFRWRVAEFALLALALTAPRKPFTLRWEAVLFPAWAAMLALVLGGQYGELQVLTVFAFGFIALAMRDSLDEQLLLNAVSAVLVFQCFLVLWQWGVMRFSGAPAGTAWFWPLLTRANGEHPGGTIGNASVFGAYVAVAWPFLWRGRWRWAVPMAVLAVLAVKSHTALLAMAAVGFFWTPRAYRLPFLGAAAVGVVLAGPASLFSSAWTRIEAWQALMPVLDQAPVYGHGLGSFTLRAFQHARLWVHPHNEWIQVAHDTGALGLILAGLTAWPFVSLVRRNETTNGFIWRASLAGLAIGSLTLFPFRMAETAFLGLAVLAVACRREETADA